MSVIESSCETQGHALRTIVVNGAYDASRALSKWFKQGIRVTTDGFVPLSLQEILAMTDEPDEVVVAAQMALAGDLNGHLVMTLSRDSAFQLIDVLLEQPEGTSNKLGEMEMSCIQETASIMGASFLNSLSSGLKIRAEFAAPVCVEDTSTAIIGSVLTKQGADVDKIMLAKTDFMLDNASVDFGLFLIPTGDSYRLMIERSNPSAVVAQAMKTIVINGAFKASRSLSKWFRRGVRVTADGFEKTCLSEISESFEEMADQDMVVLHVPIHGELQGDVLQCFPMPTALRLVDALLSKPAGTTTKLGAMERSCLAETANILTHSFVNGMASGLGVSAIPGPPDFVDDMTLAVLRPRLNEETTAGEDILSARTVFIMEGTWGDWTFLFLPTPKAMGHIEAHCM